MQDDNAALTLLSAAVSKDDVWYAWFRNKGTGKTDRLKVGEKRSVSEINVEIVSVTNRFITLKDPEGLWKLQLGDTLRERKLIEPAVRIEETPPAADSVEPTSTAVPAPREETALELSAGSSAPAELKSAPSEVSAAASAPSDQDNTSAALETAE